MGNVEGYVKLSASQSFSTDEVELLHQLLAVLLRGGDTKVLVKHRAFANLMRKTAAMQRRIAVQREQREKESDNDEQR